MKSFDSSSAANSLFRLNHDIYFKIFFSISKSFLVVTLKLSGEPSEGKEVINDYLI